MNDLAEKALHGLDVARRAVCARPMLSFAVLGFGIGCVAVVAGGDVGAVRPTRPLSNWLRLQETHPGHGGDWLPGTLLVAAIVALVLAWVAFVEVVRRRPQQPIRHVWLVAGAWAAPFAIGPPLMDTTVYSYAAFGLVQRHGHSPYDGGPGRLGDVAIVAAVDPSARETASSAGPLGTAVQHLAVSIGAGSALVSVLVLRVIAVLAVLAIGRYATYLAARRPAPALALTVLNPLTLLYLVSACHLDGLMLALVLGALVAARQRRWTRAVILVSLAGSVSGQAFVVLPVLITVHWLGRRPMPGWQLVGRDVVVAAATVAAIGLAITDGFGWVHTVRDQFAVHTPYSVTGAVGKMLTPIVRGASYDDLAAGARITALTALACTIGYLLVTARRRPIEHTSGYVVLAVALLAPVLYPWYLLWGSVCLAPLASGERRIAVLALSAAGCLLAPPGFGATATDAIPGAWLFVVAAVTATVLVHRQRAARHQLEISRTAGRTSARYTAATTAEINEIG
jgi:hypothetical protein